MFGISTHLYVGERLDRDHLVEIAAHGFEAIELFALREHFDYRDRRAAVALAEWLDDTRLRLHSMHAPIAGRYAAGAWKDGLSLASADEPRRKAPRGMARTRSANHTYGRAFRPRARPPSQPGRG